MTYPETLDYLFSQLPMYQRVGQAAYKADLSNTIALCNALDHPETKFPSIHVAGTNGKGSTSHMIASVLQEAGHKVGLYTSPHLVDFRERVRINGTMIPEDDVVAFVEQNSDKFEAIGLSFFEWTIGLAFTHFANENVDIAVLETGMGGRLDSTNIVTPLVSVITNIGHDHMQFLGDTLEKVAEEKAGIIKQGIPVVIGETQPEVAHVFQEKANKVNAPIHFADTMSGLQQYQTDLKGEYQTKNLQTAIVALQVLETNSHLKLSENSIEQGLAKVAQTGIKGRWQILANSPLTICDTGHNKEGLTYILNQLEKTPHQQLHFVFGTVNDKNVSQLLSLLPEEATYYFCQADVPRAMPSKELFQTAQSHNLRGSYYSSVSAALEAARAKAAPQDIVFIGGSTFVVAEVIE